MKPRPPTWTIIRMIPWPRPLQCAPVSTTASPVTVTAEVAVKTAWSGEVVVPAWVDQGSISNTDPIRMTTTKPATT